MTYTLRFIPEIEEDITFAHTWYEAKSTGLGFYISDWKFQPNTEFCNWLRLKKYFRQRLPKKQISNEQRETIA